MLFVSDFPTSFTNSQRVSGYGFDAGRTVFLQLADGTPVSTSSVADANGSFTVTLDEAHQFRTSGDQLPLFIHETDASGQVGLSYFPTIVTYDVTPPTVTIASGGGELDRGVAHLTGSITAPFGAGPTAGTIEILDDGHHLGLGAVNLDGSWSATVTVSGRGAHTLTAQVTDFAGNFGTSNAVTASLGVFGTFAHDGHAGGGAVYALYDGLLGRTSDALGLEGWSALIKGGLSLHDVAAGFLASTEGQSRAGAADNAAFVEQLYEANLHRASDPDGKAGWVHELDTGHMDRAGVALGFALSDEHLANLAPAYQAGVFVPDQTAANVARLYDGLLGRAPDAGGLAALTSQVAHGTSLHDVAARLLGSTEYRAVSTSYTDAGFVDALYGQVLGRTGDSGGVAGWNDYLAHGGTRGAVIDGFTASAEFQGKYAALSSRDYVEQLYEHILNRTGDAGGLSGWAGLIDNHALSRTQVAQGFTSSAEFQGKYVVPGDAAFVDGLYVGALGRHADAGGLAGWSDLLARGTSRADVAVGIAESPEAQAHHLADIEQGWHLT